MPINKIVTEYERRLIVFSGQLRELRDRVRQLMGPAYLPKVELYRSVLTKRARAEGRPVTAVALDLCHEIVAFGGDPALMACALVDTCEDPGVAHVG